MNRYYCQAALLLIALICATGPSAHPILAQEHESAAPVTSSSQQPSPSPPSATTQPPSAAAQQPPPSSSKTTAAPASTAAKFTPAAAPQTQVLPQTQAPPSMPAPPPMPAPNDQRLFLADERNEAGASAPSVAGLLARTLGALLLIIGLIVAAAWALKRMGGARFGAPRENAPELTVLATVALGDRRSITAVRFGERTLLLGSTAQGITLLATEEHSPVPSIPPMRSVADLLQDQVSYIKSDDPVFNQELLSAEQRFASVRDAEREEGEQA